MKSNFYFLFFVLFSGSIALGQNITNPYEKFVSKIKKNRKGEDNLFNDETLNIFSTNKIGTVFGGTNDLSLQKYFATLDASDNSISIGVNFDSRCSDETKKLSWVFSGAVKAKAKNKFATFYKDGDFQEDNIGTSLKLTYIRNTLITYNSTERAKVEKHRNYLKTKYYDKANKLHTELQTYSYMDANEKTNYINTTNSELFIEMAKEEIAYIEKNSLYNLLFDHWYSIEVYTPLGENRYKVTNDGANALSERTFYALSATLSANCMFLFSNGCSVFLKGKYSLKNNNNIIVDDLKSLSFQTTTNGAGNMTVVTNIDEGYITDFSQFFTRTLTLEPALFTLNNTIGFSPSIEFNFGEYKKTNWKLGIPFSFKDKEKKPKINFEIQWKEINTFHTNVHLVGISANYQFGSLIN